MLLTGKPFSYIFGVVGILMAVLWAIIAKDLPEQHKMVNDAEKDLLLKIVILSQLRNLYHRGNVFKSFQLLRNRITILCSSVCYRVVPNMVTNIFN